LTLDSSLTETTDSAGFYSFSNIKNGYHTLTPNSTDGRLFSPEKRVVFVNGKDIHNTDFTGKATYNLTVNTGFGSGRYTKNDIIDIAPATPNGISMILQSREQKCICLRWI